MRMILDPRVIPGVMVLGFALLSAMLLAAPSKPDKAEPVAPEGPDEAIDKALTAQLTLPKQSVQTEDAEKQAQESMKAFLAPEFAPPQGARFVLFPTNGKDTVDCMFLRYDVKGATITVAQSMWVFSVQIERPEWAESKKLLKAEEILAEARRLFKDGGRTKEGGTLKIMDENGPEGRLTIDWGAKGRPQDLRFTLHPFEMMLWQQDEGRLIFWLGNDPNPTEVRAAIGGGDIRSNLRWFSWDRVKPTLPTGEKQK